LALSEWLGRLHIDVRNRRFPEDVVRYAWAAIGLVAAVVIGGCSGGELSLTEYVEELNAVVGQARQEYEELVANPPGAVLRADGEQLAEFTPQDLQWALERVSEIGVEVEEGVAAIEPPELVAELHDFYFDFGDDSFTAAQDALAVRAGTAASWEELSASPEMESYRAALVRDKQWCADLDAGFDATAEREAFADVPWLPGEMKEVVESVLGCEGYPEHPEDVYRPSPTSP
jgi:hypothetical protein